MGIESLESWDWLKWLSAGLGPTLILLWVSVRSRSWHVLFEFIWRLLHGRTPPEGRLLRVFHAERTALMRFRWITGMGKVRTIKKAKALAAWCQKNDEEVSDVWTCRHYFDVEKIGLKKTTKSHWKYLKSKSDNLCWLPGGGMRGFMFVARILSVMGMIVSAAGIMLPGVILQFKEGTETLIVLYPDQVALLRSPEIRFAAVDCDKNEPGIAKRTDLLGDEVHAICKWLKEPEAIRSKYIDRTLKGQRWAFVALMLIALWLFAIFWRHYKAIYAVEKMQKRLDDKNASRNAESENAMAAQFSPADKSNCTGRDFGSD